jgi:hypothetical protein
MQSALGNGNNRCVIVITIRAEDVMFATNLSINYCMIFLLSSAKVASPRNRRRGMGIEHCPHNGDTMLLSAADLLAAHVDA